jgi:plastocyanin
MKILTALALSVSIAFATSHDREELRGSYLERADPLPPGAAAGKLEGRVIFEGEPPKLAPLEAGDDKSKGCTKPGVALDKTDRSMLIGKELGIKNVVVSIAVKDAKLKLPEKPIVLDQIACVFEPHVILLPVGSTVEYLNSDSISHNVRTLARKHEAINKTVAPGGKETQLLDQGADKIEIKCDLHPWMNAWLFVSETPYAAITDADGKFEVPGLPPGEYKLTLWHERLPKAEAVVVVKPDGASEPVTVKLAEKKKKRE